MEHNHRGRFCAMIAAFCVIAAAQVNPHKDPPREWLSHRSPGRRIQEDKFSRLAEAIPLPFSRDEWLHRRHALRPDPHGGPVVLS